MYTQVPPSYDDYKMNVDTYRHDLDSFVFQPLLSLRPRMRAYTNMSQVELQVRWLSHTIVVLSVQSTMLRTIDRRKSMTF